ncbi:MAG: FecR family protein [Bacteroidia bacterium]|nr:FecR family protein [Bacteroidia bacterium]
MYKIKDSQYIACLIYRQQTGRLNEKETEELNNWLTESDTHQALYEHLLLKEYAEDIQRYNTIDTNAVWEKYTNKYLQTHKYRKVIVWWSVVAACFVGLIMFFVISPEKRKNGDSVSFVSTIEPGKSKALLILDNGKSIDLGATGNNFIHVSKTANAANTGNQISYTGNQNTSSLNEKKDVFNEIIIPRGGEYKIILADGTQVWLNSQTKLKYPISFTEDVRNVYLEGEAYFDVAPNVDKPFFVYLNNKMKVQALGTSFNIRAYPDENRIEAVLEEGRISIENNDRKNQLQPNHLFAYDKVNNTETITWVDTELYTAWRKGRYIFYNESIEQILIGLSRWYNIEVEYESQDIKHLRFSGDIRKYESINPLLEAFETSGGVKFEIHGNYIVVK